ncbi:MAG TPA: phenylalanine--tRNA ligase subunit beta, partial [Actinomycetota bacterium]|nr:phenylalanine--tRNA ligase subunit beta [Actinomycetota bacterium]
MRVPLRWLRELTDVDAPPEKLAGLLDLSGTKVEAVHRPHGEVSGVVVAEVLGIRPHPNADNLTLVEVTPGRGEVQEVVCGARNFAVGDRVPLATVGAKLPDLAV